MSAEESKTAGFEGTVLVVGATGNIGQATVKALSAKYGASATIKAGTRSVESDKAKALAKLPGVTAVKAGASDASTVTEEAKGADVVVIITPGTENRAELAVAAARAATAGGVTNIAVVSVPFTDAHTHLFARQFRKLEAGVREVAEGVVFLKLPFFTDNNWGNVATVKGMGKIFNSVKPDTAFVSVAAADAGEAFAAVVGDFDTYRGKSYTLVSDCVSQASIAKSFSTALGKEVTYVQVPDEGVKEALTGMGFPGWQVDGILELNHLINDGDANLVTPTRDLETLIGRKPTTTAAWIESVKGAFQ